MGQTVITHALNPRAGAPVVGWAANPQRPASPLTSGGQCLFTGPVKGHSVPSGEGLCTVCGAVALYRAEDGSPLAQGVTLAKADAPVRRAPLPARVIYRPTVIISGHARWDRVWATPRADIAAWVADALAQGEYAYASHLSAYLHAPVPRLPEGVVILPTQ